MEVKILSRWVKLSALVAAICFVLFSSCGKKWKETARAEFTFGINQSSMSWGNVVFDDGSFRLTSVEFSGSRKRGDAVYFQNNAISTIDFSSGEENPAVVFDLPQGTYTSIDMVFRADPESAQAPALGLVGTFVNWSNDTIPVYFDFHSSQEFSVRAQNADGGNEITIVEGEPVSVTVTFDPVFWFDPLSYWQFENATYIPVNSVPSIVIDATNYNTNLYQSVYSRIGQSTKVVFN